MPQLIERPTVRFHLPGINPKLIEEFVGRVATANEDGEYCQNCVSCWLVRSGPKTRIFRDKGNYSRD